MKQDQHDEIFQEGDLCHWREALQLTGSSGTGVLIRKTKSYMTGVYWEILSCDGTLVLVQEKKLEKVELGHERKEIFQRES
tara:strand:+ start:1578 stop:1820 length:243 start_codon:yes stop_codon:yes gene_type:complete